MSWQRRLAHTLRNLFRKPQLDREFDEELRFHLEKQIEENLRCGMTKEEARRQALLELGGAEQVKEQVREARSGFFFETLWQDARYGARMLLKNPGFTAVAVLTLALGLGANTAIFSVVHAVLLRPLAYPHSERLAVLHMQQEPYGDSPQLAYLDFVDIRRQSPEFENVAALLIDQFVVLTPEQPVRVNGLRVTSSFFSTLGVQPVLGRGFFPEEENEGKDRVAVVSDRFWRRQLGSDPRVLGKPVTLDRESYTVVGVLPADFDFVLPLSSSYSIEDVDVFTPLAASQPMARNRAIFTFEVLARLKPETDWTRAQSALDTIAARLQSSFPDTNAGRRYRMIGLQNQVVGNVRPALLVLFAATGLVLLIACANLGSLLLARATARQREFSIRAALGAGRGRLMRQSATESALLAALGGGAGLLLAVWVLQALVQLPDVPIPRLDTIAMDSSVLLFAAALTGLTALLSSLAPILSLGRTDVLSGLRDASRTATGHLTVRLRSALVVSQVAVACVLLVGSVLLLFSMAAVLNAKSGFNGEQVLTMRVSLTQQRYETWQQVTATLRDLSSRVALLPGVLNVGLSGSLPLSGHNVGSAFWIEGREPGATQQPPTVHWQYVFPGYFRAMGIPLVRGRDFREADQERKVHQTIVSESLARLHFPGEDPIGKRVYYGTREEKPEWHEIIGVVGDVRHGTLEEKPEPRAYDLFGQHNGLSMFLIVRTANEPASASSAIQRILRELDPEAPLYRVATMEELRERSLGPRRYLSLLVGCFAALAFILAAVGVHGVVAYSVQQRTPEIGVRVALGAQRVDILALVLRQGMTLALAGLAIGLIVSLGLSRVLQTLLYGVTATDLPTYALVAVLVPIFAALACWAPARRATRVDPIVALRYE